MSGLWRALLAVCFATLALSPGAHAAAWLPATELRPIATDFGEALAFNASGEAIVVVLDEVTVVQPAFRIWRRPPGGSFVEQVVPEGGDSDIPTNSAPHLAMNGVGGAVLAWRQTDGLFYSLRDPGGAFGPPQEITVLNMTGLVSLDVELDGAGNVTFAWATVTGSAPNQVSQVRAVQRKPDGTFVSPQTLESAGPGSTTFGDVSLSVNEAGRAVVSWASLGFGPGPSRFAFRDAPLSLFDPFVNAGPGHSGLAAAMGENGAGVVLYLDLPTLLARYRTPQGVLDAESALGAANSPPRVALAADGTATALWVRAQSDEQLMSCRFTTGACFEPAQTVASTANFGAVELAVNSSGHAVAAWSEGFPPQTEVRAAVRAPNGPFGSPTPIGPLISSTPVVGVDDLGHGIAAFRSGGSMKYSAYDPVPPRIEAVTSPDNGLMRQPLPFSAAAFDVWGPVVFDWRFGDGGSAQGATVTHEFQLSGVLPVTLTATDAAGNASSEERAVSIAPAPRFTRGPTITPVRFAVARGRTPTRGNSTARRGATFRYSLDREASVRIRIERALPGRRVRRGSRVTCVAPRPVNRRARRCTRYRRAGTLIRTSHQGRNAVKFTGRIGRRALRLGRYQAVFTARDAAGNAGPSRRVRFRVVRR
jgi:PKD domain